MSQVQISADISSISSDPIISGLELFRYLPPVDAATVASYSLLSPIYLTPSSSSSSSSSSSGEGGAIWKGIAVGASLMVVVMVVAVTCCVYPGWGFGAEGGGEAKVHSYGGMWGWGDKSHIENS